MAMVKCRECGKEVSSEAPSCPNCGIATPGAKSKVANAARKPVTGLQGCLIIVGLLVIVGIIGNSGSTGSSAVPQRSYFDENKYLAQVNAEDAVKQRLRDPESAQFSDVTAFPQGDHGITVCGYVNAKNGFGGYTGKEGFVAAGDVAYLQNEMDDFSTLWNKACHANGMISSATTKKRSASKKSAKP